MHERRGLDELPAHLEKTYGMTVTKTRALDVGVMRVDRVDGDPVVARVFSASRPHAAAEADLAVLVYLAELGFRAERPFGTAPLSVHQDQAVLVTDFVRAVPKAKQPPYPIIRLGRMMGVLHKLPVPPGADRPSGALHHFAEGTMTDELRATAGWLDSVEPAAPADAHDGLAALRDAVAAADGGDGLPEAFVHPDPAPKNAIFTADGPVLVDWTSAGRGPRLASMTLVLRSGWAAVPFMKGYTREVTLDVEERDRLAGLLFSRGLIHLVFRTCLDPTTAGSVPAKLRALRRDSETKARDLLSI
jgi:Ser/Thr protein kinase RdoA (MazF antagonist)